MERSPSLTITVRNRVLRRLHDSGDFRCQNAKVGLQKAWTSPRSLIIESPPPRWNCYCLVLLLAHVHPTGGQTPRRSVLGNAFISKARRRLRKKCLQPLKGIFHRRESFELADAASDVMAHGLSIAVFSPPDSHAGNVLLSQRMGDGGAGRH